VSNDGLLIVIEPQRTDTRAYQYFMDHFWTQRVERRDPLSAFHAVAEETPLRQQAAVRVLESQLMAYFSENDVEIEDAGLIARETYAARTGSNYATRRLISLIEVATRTMVDREPPLLHAASPLKLTRLGRGVVLGGISAQSGRFVRDYLVANKGSLPSLLEQRGPAWVALRCAWLPWEAIEKSDAYQARARLWRTTGFGRAIDSIEAFEDRRLDKEYALGDMLLAGATYESIADSEGAQEVLPKKKKDARIADVIDWANDKGGILAWTLTGVLRIAESLMPEEGEEDRDGFSRLGEAIRPFIEYLPNWVPGGLALPIVKSGVIDRDSALRLMETAGLDETATFRDLADWLEEFEGVALELVGSESFARLHTLIDRAHFE
jgi:hypothetical protein